MVLAIAQVVQVSVPWNGSGREHPMANSNDQAVVLFSLISRTNLQQQL